MSGVTALRYLTVPMFRCVGSHTREECVRSKASFKAVRVLRSVFRRSTTLIVVAGEWILFQKSPTPQGLVGFLLVSSR